MVQRPQQTISGCPALLLAPSALPAVILVKLTQRAFGLKETVNLTCCVTARPFSLLMPGL